MANYLPEHVRQPYFEWLQSVDAAGWHQSASEWNWDYGDDYLFWIVQQELCDRATALMIFWQCSPDYYWDLAIKNIDWLDNLKLDQGDIYRLMVYILERWKTEGFKSHNFAFDPVRSGWAYPGFIERSRIHDPLSLPPDMMRALQGREIKNYELVEGVPLKFWSSE